MPLKKFEPTTPVLRFKQLSDKSEITADKPYKPLTEGIQRTCGRNNTGRTTSRNRGGGHKRLYRIIDFRRNRDGISAVVETIEYDPNRTANIALVRYADGRRTYILAPEGMKTGDALATGESAEYKSGNVMFLRDIPLNAQIHNLEVKPGRGGQMVRSAGAVAEIIAKDGAMVQVRLPSGEIRLVSEVCRATIGQVSNIEHLNEVWGSAGRSRWLGYRPKVRGVAMNPVDHPLGGGEGRSSGGRHPVTPWGKKCKGRKTRNNKRTDKFIARRRQKRS